MKKWLIIFSEGHTKHNSCWYIIDCKKKKDVFKLGYKKLLSDYKVSGIPYYYIEEFTRDSIKKIENRKINPLTNLKH